MQHMKRILAVIAVLMLLTTSACAANEKVTVTAEEYALIQKYKRLEEIRNMVAHSFLWEYDEDKLMEYAAQGMLGALGDDYSYYYTPAQMEGEQTMVTGEYGGIGFEVYANPSDLTITIRRVFYGSPAQQAGLHVGDKIMQVNGEDMTAYDLNKAVSIMRGEVGGEVKLTILRDKELFEVTCYRAIVQTETISSEVLDDNIGYVRIHYFEGALTSQFAAAVEKFKEQGVQGLIIDLRDNPGGLVNLAVDIADVFLDDEIVVASTEDKYGRSLSYYAKPGAWDIPVVVLMNEHSASASEILAVALMETGVAKSVGVKTFGKGIMQTVYTFYEDGAGLQLTTDYWKSPEGNNIHEVGITPDYVVEMPEDALDDNFTIIRDKDTQLQKAVEVLTEMMGE